MNEVSAGRAPLLWQSFDDLEAPPPPPQASRWQRWSGRIVSTISAGSSLALRCMDISPLTNAIGSFGTGFFTQASISSGFSGDSIARIRQVCLTMFGATSLFFLSQGYANTSNNAIQTLLTHAIIAELGANVETISRWLYQQGAVRVESHALATVLGDKFKQLSCINQTLTHILKLIASGGCGTVYFLTDDSVLKGITSFAAMFFTFQVIGERLIIRVDAKITQHDSVGASLSLAEARGTRYRQLKTGLTTLAYVAIPLSFIPWTANPDSEERVKQLVFVGGSLGLFDGIMDESKMARLRNIPINRLEEFQRLTPPQSKKPPAQRTKLSICRELADRVWRVAVPIVSIGGMVGFVVWQEGFVLEDRNSRMALGTMLGSFLGTFGLCKVVDWTWNPDKRHWLRDKLMTFCFVSPRVFGIHPLYVYLAGTNALAMDSRAIESEPSRLHTTMIIVAWGSYGFSLANELYRTSCDRIGTPLIKYPVMAIANGANTFKLSVSGVVP